MRRLTLFGHPLHPPSTHLPMGLLMAAPAGDLAYWWTGDATWRALAFWALALGLAASLPAVATGLLDFLALENSGPAAKDAFRHMGTALSALGLCAASLHLRGGPSGAAGSRAVWGAGFSLLGSAVLAVAGWYGGHLVYRHGAGVSPAKGSGRA